MLRFLFLAVIAFSFLEVSFAQNQLYLTQHRPAGLNWQELKSPHFRIIFAEGQEVIARRSARILESQYDLTYGLTGGKLKNFPVVLIPYNDLTNGFVTPLNFRSEVDLAPFKGKSLNPQSGLWMESVLPHELLHANHSNVTSRFSLGTVVGIFSPDFERAINFFPPLGVHEGLAVYHESEHGILETSGRLNHSFFQNQFTANLVGNNTWNLGQSLIISENTNPGDRHYIGGAHFTKWLHESYGDDISRRAIKVHQNMFFLGYGYALRKVTGKWPKALYQQYIVDMESNEDERLTELSTSTDDLHSLINSPYKGVRQNSPVWISDTKILYQARQYNAPSALYTFDTLEMKHSKVREQFMVSDFYMDFDASSNQLYLAEYFALSREVSNYQSDLISLDVESGRTNRLTKRQRLFSPVKIEDHFLALKPDGDVANVVRVDGEKEELLTSFNDKSAVGIAGSNLNENELAIIVNQRGIQALWLTTVQSISNDLERNPDIAFKGGSIHDVTWHPSERKILFTVDQFPSMNVFEYNLDSQKLIQITNSRYNAFEADYSPDGSSIAYVTQVDNEQRIAVLQRDDFYGKEISGTELLAGNELSDALNLPILGDELLDESSDWEISEYSVDLNWLKPRAVLPVAKERSTITEWGVNFLSTDVLQSQSYSVELTNLQDMFWYNASYSNKTFFPGFGLSAYREPDFVTFNLQDVGLVTLLQEEKGFSLSTSYVHYFNRATRFSSFLLRPSIHRETLGFYDLVPDEVSDNAEQWKAGFYTQLNYRIVQRARDIQPSSGIQLYAQYEQYLNESELTLRYSGNRYGLILPTRNGLYYGANLFTNILPKTNHSLLLSTQFLNQSANRIYSNNTIIPPGVERDLFPFSEFVGRFSSRYAIPLTYPDNGGFLVPFYISNVYMTLFSHTLIDFENSNAFGNTRNFVGAGIHLRYKVSNINIDFGVGITYDLNKNSTDLIFGSF